MQRRRKPVAEGSRGTGKGRADATANRCHGDPPYRVAVIHGGPGAAGEMAPVARVLARRRGILEPIQTAASVDGQVDELRETLIRWGDLPAVLVGFSWGAWLSFILAARCPGLVRKLILVSSGPFRDGYAAGLDATRMERLTEGDREAFRAARAALSQGTAEERDAALARLGKLATRADAYDPLPESTGEAVVPDAAVFERVWSDAAELRRSGELLELGHSIRCPVVGIHGRHDPHPPEGVREPLTTVLELFRFVVLERCGHKPWIERHAREAFFRILNEEIQDA